MFFCFFFVFFGHWNIFKKYKTNWNISFEILHAHIYIQMTLESNDLQFIYLQCLHLLGDAEMSVKPRLKNPRTRRSLFWSYQSFLFIIQVQRHGYTTLFRQTLFRQTLFRQCTVRTSTSGGWQQLNRPTGSTDWKYAEPNPENQGQYNCVGSTL